MQDQPHQETSPPLQQFNHRAYSFINKSPKTPTVPVVTSTPSIQMNILRQMAFYHANPVLMMQMIAAAQHKQSHLSPIISNQNNSTIN